MTAIGLPVSRRDATLSDAQIKSAHYRVDLRVHALIVLLAAISIAYLGYRVWDLDIVMVAGEPVRITTAPDFLSYGIVAIIVAVAAICLVEAGQTWRQAAMIDIPRDRHPLASNFSLSRLSQRELYRDDRATLQTTKKNCRVVGGTAKRPAMETWLSRKKQSDRRRGCPPITPAKWLKTSPFCVIHKPLAPVRPFPGVERQRSCLLS